MSNMNLQQRYYCNNLFLRRKKKNNLILIILQSIVMTNVRVRAQIGIMGLGPYSGTWIHSRRNKWVGDAQSVESRKEKMNGYNSKSLYSSDTKNIGQADI